MNVKEPSNIIYNTQYTTAIISFLRRTGLGFVRHTYKKVGNQDSEIDDIDVGPIESLSLDLDI